MAVVHATCLPQVRTQDGHAVAPPADDRSNRVLGEDGALRKLASAQGLVGIVRSPALHHAVQLFHIHHPDLQNGSGGRAWKTKLSGPGMVSGCWQLLSGAAACNVNVAGGGGWRRWRRQRRQVVGRPRALLRALREV